MPHCTFAKCTNSTKRKNKVPGVTFHSLPKDAEMRHKWVQVIRKARMDSEWMANKYTRVCSSHFEECDMYMTNKGLRKIKKEAVPFFQNPRTRYKPRREDSTSADGELSDVSVSSEVLDSPRRAQLKERVLKLSEENTNLKSKVRLLKKQNVRLQKKCRTHNTVMKVLIKKQLITHKYRRELEVKAGELIDRKFSSKGKEMGNQTIEILFPEAIVKYERTTSEESD